MGLYNFIDLYSEISKVRIIKNATGSTGARPYKYATLDNIMNIINPILIKNDCMVISSIGYSNDDIFLKCSIINDCSDDSNRDDDVHILCESKYFLMKKTDSINHQKLGSAITYGRRYCICAMLGIVADEDDDGYATTINTAVKSSASSESIVDRITACNDVAGLHKVWETLNVEQRKKHLALFKNQKLKIGG